MTRKAASTFAVRPLDPSLDRTGFRSGSPALDRYFIAQVTQDIRRRVTSCFVASHSQSGELAGYYTLASASIPLEDLGQTIAKKLPRYPSVPAVRMGRLAIDQRFKGIGLGAALLADALARSASAEIAAFALIVDAKDAEAAAFYRHHGFIELPDRRLTLFLPLASIRKP